MGHNYRLHDKIRDDKTELEMTGQNGRRETGQDGIRDDRTEWQKRNGTEQKVIRETGQNGIRETRQDTITDDKTGQNTR